MLPWLAGCGTPFASVPSDDGHPLMLPGQDPTAWTLRDGRRFIFGDVPGQTAWSLASAWNIKQADRLWPTIAQRGWRAAEGAGQPALGDAR